MRPRLIAVDDEIDVDRIPAALRASMRPRLIAVDDGGDGDAQVGHAAGFNEATAYCRG